MTITIVMTIVTTRRRQWHPTPVLLPGKFYRQRRLAGSCREVDTTEQLSMLHCTRKQHPVFKESLERLIREGNGSPLQHSCLANPMDGGAWWAAVHGVTKSQTRLSDFTFTFHFPALEREMATHSSVLAWRIPGTREPGGLPSMGLHRVGHD